MHNARSKKKSISNDNRSHPLKHLNLEPSNFYNSKIYRISDTGWPERVVGPKILLDMKADVSRYEDKRTPSIPGKTIKNPFRAYGGGSSLNTVKG